MTQTRASLFFLLHHLTIELSSPDEAILEQWAYLLAGWLAADGAAANPPDIRLELSLRDHLPPRPSTPPLFTDQDAQSNVPAILTVYPQAQERVSLHFHGAGLVSVPLTAVSPGEPLTAVGVVTPESFGNGRFEDVTFTSLAPLLRRHGFFLLHAFAAAREGRAALLVGASGSGKTTTGLSLLLSDWELLSNDVVLLQMRPDGVYALAMPDMLSIRPFTLDLLPALASRLNLTPAGQPVALSAFALTNGRWALPAPVTAVYFPQITDQPARLSPLNRAVCLAHLLEQSVDQWDTAVFADHMTLLHTLSQQAAAYTLHLGPDVERLSHLISA